MTALSTFGLGFQLLIISLMLVLGLKDYILDFFSLVFSNDFCFHWFEKDPPAILKIRNLTALMMGIFNIVSCSFVELYFQI